MPWGPGGYTALTTPVGSDSAYIEGWRTWQRVENLRAAGQVTLPDSSRTVDSLDPYDDQTGYAFWYLGTYLRTARGDASGPRLNYLTVVAPKTGAFVENARDAIVRWTEQLNAAFPPAAAAITYQAPTPAGTPPGVQTVAQATALQLNAQAGIAAQQAAQAAQIQAQQQAAAAQQAAAQQAAEQQRQAQLAAQQAAAQQAAEQQRQAQLAAQQLAAQQAAEQQRQAQLAAQQLAAQQQQQQIAAQQAAVAQQQAAEAAAQQAADRIAAAQQLAAEAQRQQAAAQTIAEQAAARQASDIAAIALASAQRDAERAIDALTIARANVEQVTNQAATATPSDTLFGFDKKILLIAAAIAAGVFLFKE